MVTGIGNWAVNFVSSKLSVQCELKWSDKQIKNDNDHNDKKMHFQF